MSPTLELQDDLHHRATAPLALFDCVDQPVLVLGHQHTIMYANPSAARVLIPANATWPLDRMDVTQLLRAEDLRAATFELNTLGSATLRVQPLHSTQHFEMSLTDHRTTPGVAGVVATFRSIGHQAEITVTARRSNGHHPTTLFSTEVDHRSVFPTDLPGELRTILAGRGPDVAFQPIVDLRSGRTIAVEALARWHSPTHGPISPDRFVAMAEQMGLVSQLDRHVMRKACRAIAGQRDPSSGWPLDLTVNASTLSLCHPGAARRILRILVEEGFPAHRLILEVTESIAIEDDGVLRSQLEVLRAQGVRIAVDDFGTGQSSLAQLETLPVDIVKIDRSFLDGVPSSKRRMRYLETILAMANALGLEAIFEGIEEQAQAHALSGLGVELGQGYLLAEPTGAATLESSMVRAQRVVLDGVSAGNHWQPVLIWSDGAA